ncbi:hypothetical protein GCM10023093_12140 [Nemorincola caseinilytica]|uniref:Glycosyltransferase RgtA/B/C/D-like domain-containing protein n=1 Tax=Nemorincola caseinilytica TaxID=2054315 RepID=A0ABP8N9L3_9BACT
MAPNNKLLTLLLCTGIAFCLLQVWLPGHFLTCDGPCHLYNAGIVQHMWSGTAGAIYHRFYTLVYSTDPNSLTTFLLASLLYVARGPVAEKVFLSLYILTYILGFVALLRRLGGNSYWVLVVLLFPFTYAFAKGFYNYSFSIAFWCWMVWCWLTYLQWQRKVHLLLFFVFTALCFFTHLLPFVFGIVTCGALLLSHAVVEQRQGKGPFARGLLRGGGALALVTAPFILLAFRFTGSEGGLQMRLGFYLYRLVELVEFKYLINITEAERPWALLTGLALTILAVVVVVRMARRFTIHRYDGLLLALAMVLFTYVCVPEEFMGRMLIISIRAQLFVYILIACIIAYRLKDGPAKVTGMALLCISFLMLGICRIGCRYVADEALTDLLSAGRYIRPGSVVLPLDLAPTGRDTKGREIANRNSIFHHAAQYMAVGKPLIMLDNYEANMGYFPIRWQDDVNPYLHLSREAGIEGLPPFARIADYERRTGVSVHYVLLWCYRPEFLKDARFNELYTEIQRLYHIVYTSPSGRTILYERNKEALVMNK